MTEKVIDPGGTFPISVLDLMSVPFSSPGSKEVWLTKGQAASLVTEEAPFEIHLNGKHFFGVEVNLPIKPGFSAPAVQSETYDLDTGGPTVFGVHAISVVYPNENPYRYTVTFGIFRTKRASP